MGAWGPGIFEDDTALDILDSVKGQDAETLLGEASQYAGAANLSSRECHTILVASAILDAVANGTDYDLEDLEGWLRNQDKSRLLPHKPKLVAALKRVLSEGSELRNDWSLHEEDLALWEANVKRLIESLMANPAFER